MDAIRKYREHIFCALVTYMVATSFINQTVYAVTGVVASLVVFVILGMITLPALHDSYVNLDKDLILLTVTVIVTAVCAILAGSNLGAILIPADMAMIGYASKKIRLSQRSVIYISFIFAALVILWYSHVRWSYNFNMAGFTFMLMSYFAMILYEEKELEHRRFISIFTFLTAFILSTLYHSRTAMFGMLAFLLIYLLFDRMMAHKWLYWLIFALATLGQVLFTRLYMIMSEVFGNRVVLYKDIFSGRQEIWGELWEAFLKTPFTGIGSAYELKSIDIFEVHNGLFDILCVHGVIVFVLIMAILFGMFKDLYGSKSKTAVCAAYSMLFASFFENFFIVPPYNLLFMCFIVFAMSEGHEIVKGIK